MNNKKRNWVLNLALVGVLLGLAFLGGVNAEKVRANEADIKALQEDVEALKAIRTDIAAIRVQLETSSLKVKVP